ncbi:MAG: DUF2971 domain-containing protein [Bacteroidia bacterium]
MAEIFIRHSNQEELKGIPDTVYKYRNWADEYHKTILTSQIVFLARPTSFEDPLDCKLLKRYDLLTHEQIYNKYLQSSKEDHPNWSMQQHDEFAREWFNKSPLHDKEYIKKLQQEHFLDFDDRFGVLSLTANPSNFAMWDKYSDHHKGFCVGFNAHKMFQHLGGGGEVMYFDKLPDILPFDNVETEHTIQVFSKEKKWEFEQEYRTQKFYPQPVTNAERQIKLPADCYTEIIFGAELTDKQQEEIKAVCNDQKLNVTYFIETVDYDKQTVSIQ